MKVKFEEKKESQDFKLPCMVKDSKGEYFVLLWKKSSDYIGFNKYGDHVTAYNTHDLTEVKGQVTLTFE